MSLVIHLFSCLINYFYWTSVVATVCSTITLECTLSASLTMWQKNITGFWSSKLQYSSKQGNATTASLTICNIDVNVYEFLNYQHCWCNKILKLIKVKKKDYLRNTMQFRANMTNNDRP